MQIAELLSTEETYYDKLIAVRDVSEGGISFLVFFPVSCSPSLSAPSLVYCFKPLVLPTSLLMCAEMPPT
jgi:hypothetical protein